MDLPHMPCFLSPLLSFPPALTSQAKSNMLHDVMSEVSGKSFVCQDPEDGRGILDCSFASLVCWLHPSDSPSFIFLFLSFQCISSHKP